MTICWRWPGNKLPFEGEKVAVSPLLDIDHISLSWWFLDNVSVMMHLYLLWANVQPVVASKWSGMMVSPGIGTGVAVATATGVVATTPAESFGVACGVLLGKAMRGNTKKNRTMMMAITMRVASITTSNNLEL